MNVKNKAILITGANRGIGRALMEESLKREAKRGYAGSRQPFAHSDERVKPLPLDVTNAAQIQEAVKSVETLDILVNNAGVDLHDDLNDRAGLDRAPKGRNEKGVWWRRHDEYDNKQAA